MQATGVVSATPNTLVQRDAAGRTQFVDPAVSADVATKGYVDTQGNLLVPKTQLGAASGVATLDGNSLITTSQIPTNLGRFLGTGTALPSSPRGSDTYFHSGLGCLMQYNGVAWRQRDVPIVADQTARNAISSNYAALLYAGFQVRQSDFDYTFEWMGSNKWSKIPGNGGLLGTTLSTSGYVAIGAQQTGVINSIPVPTHQPGPIRFVANGVIFMAAAGGNTAGYYMFGWGSSAANPNLGVFGQQVRWHNGSITQMYPLYNDVTIYSDGTPKWLWLLGWNDGASSQNWMMSNINCQYYQV